MCGWVRVLCVCMSVTECASALEAVCFTMNACSCVCVCVCARVFYAKVRVCEVVENI